MKALAVFCGSSSGSLEEYRQAARVLGEQIAGAGVTLVYGGGRVGLMGEIADAVLGCGGRVIGVIPESLAELELAHRGVTELRVVAGMHERKQAMAALADAFLAMPGGIGTLEELFEVFTWHQLGFHAKPCALLNVAGYYDPLMAFLSRMVEHRFIGREQIDSLIVGEDPADVFGKLAAAFRDRAGRPADPPTRERVLQLKAATGSG